MNRKDDQSNAPPAGIGAGSILRHRQDGSWEWIVDEVTREEPLELRLGEKSLAMTMRTPGHDAELAAGFLLAEGIVRQRPDLQEIASDSTAGAAILTIRLAPEVAWQPSQTQRFGSISTSCGLCGKTSLAMIRAQFPALAASKARLEIATLLLLPSRLRQAQANFARTGGIHAAAIFDYEGNLLVAREDVGRHNAVDKAIGHLFLECRLPARDSVLMVSGRTSLEIVQKGLAAGIPIIASVSAPTTLAIDFAREAGQTLTGFLRPPTFNIYTHVERVKLE